MQQLGAGTFQNLTVSMMAFTITTTCYDIRNEVGYQLLEAPWWHNAQTEISFSPNPAPQTNNVSPFESLYQQSSL